MTSFIAVDGRNLPAVISSGPGFDLRLPIASLGVRISRLVVKALRELPG